MSWTSSYIYDNRNNLTQITYPSGRVVTYTYDAANRITSVLQNGIVFADAFQYGETGQLVSYRTRAVTHTITYDAAARVQRLTSGSLLDLTYGYDGVGNVTSIADPRYLPAPSFGYDLLNRLVTADGPWGHLTYTYDGAGNRLTETRSNSTTTYTYAAATQQLTATTGAATESFGYNALGQLTSDNLGQYAYTPTGRLASVTSPTVSAAYAYDPEELRLARTVNGQTFYTVRSASGQVLSEYEAACEGYLWKRDLVYAGGKLLGAARANPPRPTLTVTVPAASVAEGASHVVTVRLTTPGGLPLACPVTAAWALTADTATGADYVDQRTAITFPAGTANGATASVTVATRQDALDEDDERFAVTIVGPTNAVLGSPASQTLTILDDDSTPVVSVADATAPEGQALTFTLSLSAASGRPVTVSYGTTAGTASDGADYAGGSGTVVFDAGAVTTSITIGTFADTAAELDETFALTLSGAPAGRGTATGTILDDDSVPPTGWLDAATINVATGWAYDPDYGGAIYVHAYVDGTFMAAVPANRYRPDLVPYGNGGYRAFEVPIVVGCGTHTVAVFAIGTVTSGRPDGVNPQLLGSPKTVTRTCGPTAPGGFLDAATLTSVRGWAYDPDAPNSPVKVDIYVDGVGMKTVWANQYRPDLTPYGNGGSTPTAPASSSAAASTGSMSWRRESMVPGQPTAGIKR